MFRPDRLRLAFPLPVNLASTFYFKPVLIVFSLAIDDIMANTPEPGMLKVFVHDIF